MDQYLAEVVIAFIGLIGSIIGLIIKKRSKKVENNINKKFVFANREKEINKKINDLSKLRESFIYDMMILIMDTNIALLKSGNFSEDFIRDILDKAEQLKKQFNETNDDIDKLGKEYELVLEMEKEAQAELTKLQKKKNNNNDE